MENPVNGEVLPAGKAQVAVADARDSDRVAELMREPDLVFHLACLGVRHSIQARLKNHGENATGAPQGDTSRAEPVVHVYAVRSRQREALKQRRSAAGIQASIPYPISVHLKSAHADLGHRRGDFPVSEALADKMLSLPMLPKFTSEQIELLCATLNDHG